MKKTQISTFIAFILILCGVNTAAACGPEEPVSAYASKPFDILRDRSSLTAVSDTAASINSETISFWKDYTGGNVPCNAIARFFNNTSFSDFNPGSSSSPFIKWLRDNNRADALEYIGDCLEYNALADAIQEDVWNYDRPDKAPLRAFYAKIKDKKGGRDFNLRYKFLKVRALTTLRDDAELISFWKKEGSKIPGTALGRRIKGYIGGAYYRQHDYITALDYFDAANDPNSVAWCVERLVGARNLANLYEHAPKSAALEYILQDYVNYLIEAVRDPESFSETTSWMSDYGNLPAYDPKFEIPGFIALADRVLSEGRVRNPIAWATAKGVVVSLTGDYEEGLAIFEASRSLEGSRAAKDNLERFAGWALLMTWDGRQNQKASQLAAFIDRYEDMMLADRDWSELNGYSDNYVPCDFPDYNFMIHFFAKEAQERFMAQVPGRSILFMQYMNDLLDGYDTEGFLSREREAMWNGIPVATLRSVTDYMDKPESTDVDRLFMSSLSYARSLANDVMGTRMILAGRFSDAIPYLQKVRKQFIVTTATYPYLLRGYYMALWEDYNFQRSNFSTDWSPYYAINPKLDYCKDIVKAMADYDKARNADGKATAALKVAALLHVASPVGDCWAISDYSHSISSLHSNMVDMCREWLGKAVMAGADTKRKAIAYYAMLTLPLADDTTPTNLTWDEKWEYNLDSPELRQAMTWLRSNRFADGLPSYITGCDALTSYRN